MKAEDFMTKNPVTLVPDMLIVDVIRTMRKTKHESFPVLENGKIVGILTYSDIILQQLGEKHDYEQTIVDALKKKVRDIMQKKVIAVPPDMDIDAVARLIFRTGY